MGWIQLGDSKECVAFVREGAILMGDEPKLVAELSIQKTVWFGAELSSGLWTLRMGEAATGALRLMALAWLGFAWKMLRSLESFELATPRTRSDVDPVVVVGSGRFGL